MADKAIKDVAVVKATRTTKLPASNGSNAAVTVTVGDIVDMAKSESGQGSSVQGKNLIGYDSLEPIVNTRFASIADLNIVNGMPESGVNFFVSFAHGNANGKTKLQIQGKGNAKTIDLPIYMAGKQIAAGQIKSGGVYEFMFVDDNNGGRLNMLCSADKSVYLSNDYNLKSMLEGAYTPEQLDAIYMEIANLEEEGVPYSLHVMYESQYLNLYVEGYDKAKSIITLSAVVGSKYYEFTLTHSGSTSAIKIVQDGVPIINKEYEAR